jgi:hypothetical protein
MRRPGVFTRGTARDLADLGNGYAANGEGQYSRQAASPPLVALSGYVPKTRGRRSHSALIAQNVSLMAKLRGDLLLTDDPIKRARIEKNLDIKQRFIARLKAE